MVWKPRKEEIQWTLTGLESVLKVPVLLHLTLEAIDKISLVRKYLARMWPMVLILVPRGRIWRRNGEKKEGWAVSIQ